MKKITGSRIPVTSVRSHQYICDLINVEAPILSLFRDGQRNWLYLWCDTDSVQTHRWLLFPVSRELLIAYLTKQQPLLDLVKSATSRIVMDGSFNDVFGEDGELKGRSHYRSLKQIDGIGELGDYLPASDSFFDEDLTPDISLARELNPTAYDVPIDGKWFIADLDRFSRVYSQLYAFFYCTKPRFVTNLGARVRRYLVSPWTGGYSRVNLFEALQDLIPSLHDLEIKHIRYASPGEIRIEALGSVGVSIAGVIEKYIGAEDGLLDAQKMINELLSLSRLNKANLSTIRDDRLPLTQDNIQFLRSKSKEIGAALGIEQELASLYEYSPNVVVSAKVLMALVTRIRRLAYFERTGLLDLKRAPAALPASPAAT